MAIIDGALLAYKEGEVANTKKLKNFENYKDGFLVSVEADVVGVVVSGTKKVRVFLTFLDGIDIFKLCPFRRVSKIKNRDISVFTFIPSL